ncbi:DGQHR domain-containing protein [Paraburkholderia silvatlantica]|uniref:DGQHR domain-containing protein n=1 Tax=Paraburkholderia silvatlantica TaxID=321895 RepID=A0A2V4TLR5_9BURK|nr:DGQHR domain-containing protein [Paraburkholderia silvatlantica]PYE26359.1 DGQHR domain-containing protein [Paraburkholderia silvatlantica]
MTNANVSDSDNTRTLDVEYIEINQPIGKFYLAMLPAEVLLKQVDILRRGMSEEQRQNVQRDLSLTRQREIAAYISDPDATFPTSIIISLYDEAVTLVPGERVMRFERGVPIGKVLDGQHRLEGLKLARAQGLEDIVSEFQLPVVFMVGLEPGDEAYIFSTINSKQARVSSSLISDLFDLRQARSPRKTCHEIAQTLNSRPGPFYRGIKMLGSKKYDTEYLSQGTFVKELLPLITRNADEYERREKRDIEVKPDPTCPFNAFYNDGKDGVIAKVLENFFGAIAEVFPNEWTDAADDFVLRKSVGYTALMKVLKRVWQDKIAHTNDASKEAFVGIAKTLKEGVVNIPLTSQNFGSSGGGAGRLAEALLRNFVSD